MEQYIQPFIDGSEEVFRDFCGMEIKAGRAFFVTKNEFAVAWDVSGIIALSGEFNGTVAISVSENTAFALTKTLTGREYTSIESEVTDALGEIVNIITGNVKIIFEKRHRIKMTVPSIINCKENAITWPSEKARIICIPFSLFEDQELCLSVAMES